MKNKLSSFSFKKIIFVLCLLAAIFVLASYLIDRHVSSTVECRVYSSVNEAPHQKVGLLLGTSKYLSNGEVNQYYTYRIDAAVELFRAGKVNYILVSGDNSTKRYDEPTSMRDDLIAAGIPDSCIVLDYAGFRTWDSVVRCQAIFGQDSITIISQPFHIERAIYIADHKGIYATGFAAKNVTKRYGLKTMVREKLARVKLFVDILIGKEPKFKGEKIEIK